MASSLSGLIALPIAVYLIYQGVTTVILPMSVVGVAFFGGLGGVIGWRLASWVRRPLLLECDACRYPLQGVRGPTCPECGHALSAEQRRYAVSKIHGQGSQAANEGP